MIIGSQAAFYPDAITDDAIGGGIQSLLGESAFTDVVAWIEKGTTPEGDDVLGDVSRLGLRWTNVWDPRDPAAPHK
jgi:hypothetical protein